MARARFPKREDLDKWGRVSVYAYDRKKIIKVAPVDAKEHALAEASTLDLPDEAVELDKRRASLVGAFDDFSLSQLRRICTENQISHTGKPPTQLRQILIDRGIEPPNPDTLEF